jgi:MFS family permease
MFTGPLSRNQGVVVASAADWSYPEVAQILSIMAVTLGVTTVCLGPWIESAGPRKVSMAAALSYSGGLILASVGCLTQQLWLVYLGYGVFGGIGWGLGYVSPVSTLMRWFPDRRGLATGLSVAAFGGGAMIAAPFYEYLYSIFYEYPTFLGTTADVHLVTEGAKRCVEISPGVFQDVVVATRTDLNVLPRGSTALEGVYLVGTGNAGTAKVFLTLSATYFAAVTIGAMSLRSPPEGYAPKGWVPPPVDANTVQSNQNVHYNEALKTHQFYLMWLTIFGNAVVGVSIISSAKTIVNEIFSTALPLIVTGGFAASFVALLSASNMTGRLGWAFLSDYTGRKNAYYIFASAIPLVLTIPILTSMVSSNPSPLPLALFCANSFILVTLYGGVMSILPAYIADVFGPKYVSVYLGRLLTAWSAAALTGTAILTYLRGKSYTAAAQELAGLCDPNVFLQTFGAPVSQLSELLASKTVTISQLMKIVPPDTVDPTPFLFNSTMYTLTCLLGVALVCNMLIRPVNGKHFEGYVKTLGEGVKKKNIE